MSHAVEMTIMFYYPTLELFCCFLFTQPFQIQSKFCLPNPFLFGATPGHAINNDKYKGILQMPDSFLKEPQ